MDVSDLYDRTVLPLRHTVCGVRLLPLTVGHARLLDALKLWSPVGPQETILAAFVCSHTPQQVQSWLDSRWLTLFLRFWRLRLGSKWDFGRSIRTWQEYVIYHTEEPFAAPITRSTTSRATASATPRTEHMKVVLCSRCNYDPATFDDVPYSVAVLDYLTFLEVEGQATVTGITRRQLRELQRQ